MTELVRTQLPNFGHAPDTVLFWRRLARRALALAPTPGYLLASQPIADRLAEWDSAFAAAGFRYPAVNRKSPIGIRHWLSCKTQPVRPLLQWWREQGRPVEVVSEFELRAALAEGFAPDQILVNGPAKHRWLGEFAVPGLRVNFDSLRELKALLPQARRQHWKTGVRLLTAEEHDPEFAPAPSQFGMAPDEAVVAFRLLQRAGNSAETVHFHLRSNVSSVQVFARAIAEVAGVTTAAGAAVRHLDIGGGVPVRHILTRGGKVYDGEFGLGAFARMLRQAAKAFPALEEIWLENGRSLTASGGALIVRIWDVKERRGWRQLICDGGRVLNALMSVWEQHALVPLVRRAGPLVPTVVHGPTCMAFDQLARVPLPRTLRPGDYLLWLDAGAYHLAWETRFSHGHAAVCWQDEQGLRLVRPAQPFADWWGSWGGDEPVQPTAMLASGARLGHSGRQ